MTTSCEQGAPHRIHNAPHYRASRLDPELPNKIKRIARSSTRNPLPACLLRRECDA
jgi:hypothetical protein